jgi:hypothetical protein
MPFDKNISATRVEWAIMEWTVVSGNGCGFGQGSEGSTRYPHRPNLCKKFVALSNKRGKTKLKSPDSPLNGR